jgi:hypothetical protein
MPTQKKLHKMLMIAPGRVRPQWSVTMKGRSFTEVERVSRTVSPMAPPGCGVR